MKEISVKRRYREVRYSDQRPKRWSISNRVAPFYVKDGVKVNLYMFEKILLALKNTKVSTISILKVGRELVITSEGFNFEYRLKEQALQQSKTRILK